MYRIGIDLGGTSIKAGIVNEYHEIILQLSEPTQVLKPAEYTVERMVVLIKRLISESGADSGKVSFIGVGIPGAVDIPRGRVLFANNLRWYDFPLVEVLYARTNIPVMMANDAQCALMGEVSVGAAAGCQNVVMLTLGTGVGGGVLADGKLLNYQRNAGIIGHTVIHKNGRKCSCGRRGCLEAYTSASALVRSVERAAHRNKGSYLAKSAEITAKTVFEASKANDVSAKRILNDYITDLGEGITDMVNIFRPEKVIIGGGVSAQGDELLIPLRDCVYDNCFAKERLYLPLIECARLGNTAGIIGSAALDHFISEKEIRNG